MLASLSSFSLNAYLSVVTLIGLTANAAFGWWWADPVAALALVYLIAKEGREVFTRRELICVDD
jgi:divalent metal cation (Fe/Co/Zn/Cd) transporter